jgi:Tfp pilus assembly protein PilZ
MEVGSLKFIFATNSGGVWQSLNACDTKRRMIRQPSKKLRFLSYFWISLPVLFLVHAKLNLGLPAEGIVRLILSPGFWIMTAITITAGYGFLKLRWYGWYVFIFSNFFITYETAIALAYHSQSQLKMVLFFTTLLIQMVSLYFIRKEIRVPYFFPRIRWWESDPRYKLSVQTRIVKADKTEFEGEIMDLSLGGCFVKTHAYFGPDEAIELHFNLFDRSVKCNGDVVWRTESKVTHPKGIGVKFSTIEREALQSLKQATKKLKKLNRVYSQLTRERNWQEYLEREQRFQGKK